MSAQRLGKAGLEMQEGRSFTVERGGDDKEKQYKNAMETWRQMVYRSIPTSCMSLITEKKLKITVN